MSRPEPPQGSFHREGAGLEFDRVSFFSDAVFAIAMTLLVVELHVPEGADSPEALRAAIRDEGWAILGFFIGFWILGRYWIAHHRFFAGLRSIDGGMISTNLVYLAFVAFTPFPIGLISRYEEHPTVFAIFALTMATVSSLEIVLMRMAIRRGHMQRSLSAAAERYAYLGAGTPVVVMLASIPLAYLSTTLALLSWLILSPIGHLLHRNAPADALEG
jgi:uncharacterized membrane protein